MEGTTVKKYILVVPFILSVICMMIGIEWSKEPVKAFITGGVMTWTAMRFYRRS